MNKLDEYFIKVCTLLKNVKICWYNLLIVPALLLIMTLTLISLLCELLIDLIAENHPKFKFKNQSNKLN
jgi:hypothetical protein